MPTVSLRVHAEADAVGVGGRASSLSSLHPGSESFFPWARDGSSFALEIVKDSAMMRQRSVSGEGWGLGASHVIGRFLFSKMFANGSHVACC